METTHIDFATNKSMAIPRIVAVGSDVNEIMIYEVIHIKFRASACGDVAWIAIGYSRDL